MVVARSLAPFGGATVLMPSDAKDDHDDALATGAQLSLALVRA